MPLKQKAMQTCAICIRPDGSNPSYAVGLGLFARSFDSSSSINISHAKLRTRSIRFSRVSLHRNLRSHDPQRLPPPSACTTSMTAAQLRTPLRWSIKRHRKPLWLSKEHQLPPSARNAGRRTLACRLRPDRRHRSRRWTRLGDRSSLEASAGLEMNSHSLLIEIRTRREQAVIRTNEGWVGTGSQQSTRTVYD